MLTSVYTEDNITAVILLAFGLALMDVTAPVSWAVATDIAGNSASSSLLPMLDSHSSAAPHTAYVGKESVPLLTLD